MAYIGKEPAQAFTSFVKQDFSTSATTSYTLDHSVVNENELALFINFVRQEPTTAYTASGTTLTLTSATASTDDMYCVYLGKAIQTVNPPSGSVGTAQLAGDAVTAAKIGANAVTNAKLNNDIISGATALTSEPADTDEFLVSDAGTIKRIDYSLIKGGGITEVDQWRITTDHSGVSVITTNWERVDTDGGGYFGTGMSESSGVFTFPSTGYWLIMFNASAYTTGASSGFCRGSILTTLDGGTDGYSRAANGYMSMYTTGAYSNISCNFVFDVTNTADKLCKFSCSQNSSGTPNFNGATNENYTTATFIRLGDT